MNESWRENREAGAGRSDGRPGENHPRAGAGRQAPYPPRRRPVLKSIFAPVLLSMLIVSLGGPVILAASATSAPTDTQEQLKRRVQYLQHLEKLQKDEIQKLQEQIRKQNALAEAARKRVKKAKARLGVLRLLVSSRGRSATQPATRPSGTSGGGIPTDASRAMKIPGTAASFFAKMPEPIDRTSGNPVPSRTDLLSGLPEGAAVRIVPAIQRTIRSAGRTIKRPFWSTSEDGAVIIWYEKTDQLGAVANVPVGKAKARDGKLFWEWQKLDRARAGGLPTCLRDIVRLLKRATLQAVDRSGGRTVKVQFLEPQRSRLQIGRGLKLKSPLPGCRPRLELGVTNEWSQERTDTGIQIDRSSGSTSLYFALRESAGMIQVYSSRGPLDDLLGVQGRLGHNRDPVSGLKSKLKAAQYKARKETEKKSKAQISAKSLTRKVALLEEKLGISRLKEQIEDLKSTFPRHTTGVSKGDIDWSRVSYSDRRKYSDLLSDLRSKSYSTTLSSAKSSLESCQYVIKNSDKTLKMQRKEIVRIKAILDQAKAKSASRPDDDRGLKMTPLFKMHIIGADSGVILAVVDVVDKQKESSDVTMLPRR